MGTFSFSISWWTKKSYLLHSCMQVYLFFWTNPQNLRNYTKDFSRRSINRHMGCSQNYRPRRSKIQWGRINQKSFDRWCRMFNSRYYSKRWNKSKLERLYSMQNFQRSRSWVIQSYRTFKTRICIFWSQNFANKFVHTEKLHPKNCAKNYLITISWRRIFRTRDRNQRNWFFKQCEKLLMYSSW